MKPSYKLGPLLLLIGGAIGIALGILLSYGTYPDPAFAAVIWELSGLLVGGGMMCSISSLVLLILTWAIVKEKESSSNSDKEMEEKK